MPDDPAQPPLEVLLERAGTAVTRRRRRIAAARGLRPTAMAVLDALDRVDADGPGCANSGGSADGPGSADGRRAGAADAPSHRELAGRLRLSPATLTPVLDALEAAGELRRERDRTDRRIVRLYRTLGRRTGSAPAPLAPLPLPDPQVDPAVRSWLLAVLAAAEP